ncbi:MAG: flavin reductase [Clostridia bacterium]|nr:flavin reductase [Clostridia bacterium]
MKKDFGKKTWLYPMPVLMIATYGADGTPDIMNAAWGGIHDHNEIGLCLSRSHKTVQNILDRGAFTVSIGEDKYVAEQDYLGITSANKVPDKISKTSFTLTKSAHVDAPVINELSVVIECTLKSYDEESGYLIGNVVNVAVEESVLGENGLPDLDKFSPVIYDCATYDYRVLGKKVGLAYSDGKKIK